MPFLFIILSFLFSLSSTFALDVESPSGNLPYTADPSTTIAEMIKFGIQIAAVLAVMGIVWAGIQMILAIGEDEKLKKSRRTIIYSLVGLAITLFAYSIVDLIANLNLQSLQ